MSFSGLNFYPLNLLHGCFDSFVLSGVLCLKQIQELWKLKFKRILNLDLEFSGLKTILSRLKAPEKSHMCVYYGLTC